MSNRPNACEARQYSDQMSCHRCGLVWDMNDPEPPECLDGSQPTSAEKNAERQRQAESKPPAPETVGVAVHAIDGPLLELAFRRALVKAGYPVAAIRRPLASALRDLQIEITTDLDGSVLACRFGVTTSRGSTAMVAVARCFVKSVYGPEINVTLVE